MRLDTPLARQIWVASSILSLMVGNGMTFGMTTTLLPALEAPGSPIQLNLDTSSWMVAMIGFGNLASYFIEPYVISKYGRRTGMLILLSPAPVVPFLACFVMDAHALIITRFISGVVIGACGFLGLIILGEYTAPEHRGMFLTLKSGTLYLGYLVVHILGHYLHWKIVFFLSTAPYVVTGLMMLRCPESPSWLITRREYAASADAFYWLRGRTERTTAELTHMIEAQKKKCFERKPVMEELRVIFRKFKQKNFLKPCGIFVFLSVLPEVSGRHTFSAYAMQIVLSMDADPSHAFHYTLCYDVLMLGTVVVSSALVRVMRRRTLLFTSTAGSVIILLAISLFYYLLEDQSANNTISLILFAVYLFVSNLGCTHISLSLIGELFPLEHRAIGVAIVGLLMSAGLTLTLKIVPILMATIKIYGMFACFAAVMLVCVIALYFILPETKDKTLQEIEDGYEAGASEVVREGEVKRLKSEEC